MNISKPKQGNKMKKTVLFSAIVAAAILTGCGSNKSTYVTEAPAIPEVPNPNGTALIVTATDDSEAGITYTEVGDGSLLVDCGLGGCGDIYVGSPLDNSSSTPVTPEP